MKKVVKRRKKHFNYEPYIKSLMEFFNTKNNIKPYPKVKISHRNQGDNFISCKTAYYNPDTSEVTLFTHNRHVKDVLRSLSHELVHHMQNIEGRLSEGSYSGQEITNDEKLMKLEEEAYLKGNIIFRSWTESLEKKIESEPTEHMRKLIKIDENQFKELLKK